MADPRPERLRPHPEPRFAAAQHEFDLDELATRLKREAGARRGQTSPGDAL